MSLDISRKDALLSLGLSPEDALLAVEVERAEVTKQVHEVELEPAARAAICAMVKEVIAEGLFPNPARSAPR